MKILAALALSLSLTAAACAAPPAAPSESTSAASAEDLTISSESDTALAGSFVHGESVVTFDARLESPILRVKLVVNGAEFEFARDLVKSTMTIDGHSNTILAADNAALAALEKAFDGLGQPSEIREAVFKTISLLAAAPRGTTLVKKVVTPRVEQALETERGYCVSDEAITYLCSCNGVPANCSKSFVGWNGSNPIYHANGTTGVGGQVTGCTGVPQVNHEHEQCEWTASGSHGRVTGYANCGWGATECEGRCGAGCPNSYNFYYTKDCFDHDVCLDNHPSASATSTYGDCGNEFDQAAGDFSYGTGSGFASACGSYAPGENSR